MIEHHLRFADLPFTCVAQMMTGLNELNDTQDELKQKEDELAELRDKLEATSKMSQVHGRSMLGS
jgi:hypothetical protein